MVCRKSERLPGLHTFTAALRARAGVSGRVWLRSLGAREQFMVSEEREEAQSKSLRGHLDPP